MTKILLPRPREKKSPPKPRWWIIRLPDGRWFHADALTKSEARGQAKKALKLKRLPPGTVVEKVEAPTQ